MTKIAIFARVSTNVQDYERQVNELTALCKGKGWSVEAIFCEKISGARKNADRNELTRMIKYVQDNRIRRLRSQSCLALAVILCRFWRLSNVLTSWEFRSTSKITI